MRKLRVILLVAGLLSVAFTGRAQYRDDQFKRDAFTQTYADTTETSATDTSSLFNFKAYFRGLAHKQTTSLKDLTIGSAVLVGGNQIYHKQYWKLPIIYGGIGAGVYGGVHFNQLYQSTGDTRYQTYRDLSIVGAGLVWWGSLLDGVAQYQGLRHPEPSKSTFYSILLPGLGQIYNGEFWKVPIYLGLMAGTVNFAHENNVQYQRWRWIYNMATTDEEGVERPPQSAESAKYYRDSYRRLRDYCILGVALAYVLQVVDANVFAYMQDFEVNDQITLHMSPSVMPSAQYASAPALGLSVGLRF